MDKLNSNNLSEFDRYYQPKPQIVPKLPNPKSVKDFTEVYMKNSDNTFDSYKMIKGEWVKTGSNVNNITQITQGASGGSAETVPASVIANSHTHGNKAELDLVTDGNHDVRTDNPHGVTKTQVGLANVSNDAQVKIASNLSDVAAQQTALNNLTAVSGATNEYVLTKDTASGNAVFKAAAGGGGGALNDLTDVNAPTPTDGQALAWDSGTSRWIPQTISGGTSFDDSEAQTYFGALVTPLSGTQESRISELVIKLKNIFATNDLSTRFDFLYLLANETQEAAGLNLIKRAHDITNVNSVSWAQWEGFTGNGSTSYLDSNYAPSTDGLTFNINECSLGIYVRVQTSSAAIYDIGCQITTPSDRGVIILSNFSSNVIYMRLNEAADNTTHTQADRRGMYIIRRVASNLCYRQIYLPGLEMFSSYTTAASGIPTGNIFICAGNLNGSPYNYSARQYSIAFCGSALTHRETDLVTWALEDYMDAIGTGVLP